MAEPCIKLRGPGTASEFEPSRPVPTAIDGIIASEDVLLLSFAYSRDSNALADLIRIASVVYGASIQEHSLRHAILAWAACQLPPEQFGEAFLYHKQRVYSTLIQGLDQPASISDGDVFSTFLLADCAWYDNPSNEETSNHYYGGVRMLHTKLEQPETSHSRIITVFGPFYTIWQFLSTHPEFCRP